MPPGAWAGGSDCRRQAPGVHRKIEISFFTLGWARIARRNLAAISPASRRIPVGAEAGMVPHLLVHAQADGPTYSTAC